MLLMRGLTFMTTTLITLMISFGAQAIAQQSCPGFPGCLYSTPQTYTVVKTRQNITYTDVTGRPRTIEITVRMPSGRSGPLPVVIWAHGGADGRNGVGASDGALSFWSGITAAYGYLTVSPAFNARNAADAQAVCQYLGAGGDACEDINMPSWDRPFDIRAILDTLEAENRSGPLAGRIDLTRIAVGGHSAGSSGTLTVAGATREYNGRRYGATELSDPRPKAFIALGPSAPGLSYMFDTSFNDPATSWDNIARPVLVATGSGDGHEQSPRTRRIPFAFAPPGDKYQLWINDTDIGHGMFGDDLGTCSDGAVPARKCEAVQSVLVSVVRAFLDAYIEQRPQAKAYLEGGFIQQLGQGSLEWLRK
jgi:predicted dienelactone hydrolase